MIAFGASVALLAVAGAARAQEAPMTADQIVEALDPQPDAALAGSDATRAFRVQRLKRRAVELTIFFDTDSARITRRSMVQLEPLGRALQSPRLQRRGFVIIGHTDSVGSVGYNRALSLRRARSVRAYLADAYAVSIRRLAVKGVGSDEPRDPNDPAAEINRRVEVALSKTKL
jgi:outer membrane protein OmpA-like peptidoglycan-associated protein